MTPPEISLTAITLKPSSCICKAAEAPTFEELQKDLAEWGNKLGQQYPDELTECVESVLGGGKKVSACTPKQTESMAMVLDNIKSKCLELGVK